jgi:hypothetical protein
MRTRICGAGSLNLPRGLDAVGAGQADVHQHDVRAGGSHHRDRFPCCSHGTHAVHIGLGAERDQQGAGERLLVLDH